MNLTFAAALVGSFFLWIAPVQAADCLLVGMTNPGGVIALVDPVAGDVVATIPIEGEPTRIVVDPTRQFAYVTSQTCPDLTCGFGAFHVIDLVTRAVRFKAEYSAGIDVALDTAGSRVFVAKLPSSATLTGYTVDVRSTDTFALDRSLFEFRQLTIKSITFEPSIGALIVGDRRSAASTKVYAIRASDGLEIWQATLGGELSVLRAHRGGVVLVGTTRVLHLLSPDTGSPSGLIPGAIYDLDFSLAADSVYALGLSFPGFVSSIRLDPFERLAFQKPEATIEHIASSLSSDIVFGSSRDTHQIVVYDLLTMDSSRRLELPGAPVALAVAKTSPGCALEPTRSPTAEPAASPTPTPTTRTTPPLTATVPVTSVVSDGCILVGANGAYEGSPLWLVAVGILWVRRRCQVEEGK